MYALGCCCFLSKKDRKGYKSQHALFPTCNSILSNFIPESDLILCNIHVPQNPKCFLIRKPVFITYEQQRCSCGLTSTFHVCSQDSIQPSKNFSLVHLVHLACIILNRFLSHDRPV